MKILLTATVQSHICQFHRPLVDMLHKYGCEVHVAARDNLREKNGLKLDFVDKVYNVPFDRSPKSQDNIRAYKQLRQIIQEEKYDIIHCNTPMGGVVTRLAARTRRKSGTKVFYTAHGFHFYKDAPKKNWLIYYPIEKIFAHITDKLITITKEDYELAKKKFCCKSYRIHGVGINTAKYDSVTSKQVTAIKEELGLQGKYVILCTGELNTNKNQVTLIDAMQIIAQTIPNVVLLLAGNGPNEQTLRERIAEYKLDENVKMLGYHTDLEIYVHAADIVVSVSLREGLPLNIAEAMYLGKPVVVSVNRGHRELVKDGENGYLVPAKDQQKIAERIIDIATNSVKAAEFGMNGRKYAIPYTDQKVIEELREIYM